MADQTRRRLHEEDDRYRLGQRVRGAAQQYDQGIKDTVFRTGEALVRPAIRSTEAAKPFVRGLYGMAPESDAAAPQARPSTSPGATNAASRAPQRTATNSRPAVTLPATTVRPTARALDAAALPGDTNTFTANGVTRRLTPEQLGTTPATGPAAAAQPQPAAIQAPGPITAAASNAPQVQATTQRTLGAVRGNTLDARADATSMLNPMSQGAELMRRLDNVGISSQFKGSPGARAGARQAILGQLDALNASSASGQQSANELALQGAQGEGDAAESAAQRTLDAAQSNQSSDQLTAQRMAEQARPSQLVRGLDGNTTVLRNDSTTSTLRDESGNPIATPAPAAPGAVTPQNLFEAQSREIEAVLKNEALTPEDRQTAVDQISARYTQLGGAQQGGKQQFEEGRVYTDAKGNRARYANGKFIPEK